MPGWWGGGPCSKPPRVMVFADFFAHVEWMQLPARMWCRMPWVSLSAGPNWHAFEAFLVLTFHTLLQLYWSDRTKSSMVPDDGAEIGKLTRNVHEDLWLAKHARTLFFFEMSIPFLHSCSWLLGPQQVYMATAMLGHAVGCANVPQVHSRDTDSQCEWVEWDGENRFLKTSKPIRRYEPCLQNNRTPCFPITLMPWSQPPGCLNWI